MKLKQAFDAWRKIVGAGRIVVDEKEISRRYGATTEGIAARIAGALLPRNAAEISGIVEAASRCEVPLYPISTGRNWGYGTAQPAADGCVIVDLSRMSAIAAFDKELGIVTLEPGVTQGQLYDFLKKNKWPYAVPVTDAGAGCSVIGSFLERGLGITSSPLLFNNVLALEAVLPSGEIYRKPFRSAAPAVMRWGIGPYLDGMFSQSNFGIVTRMTIGLVPKSEQTAICSFRFDASAPGGIIDALGDLRRKFWPNLNFPNLINSLYALAMNAPYPRDKVPAGQAIPGDVIEEMSEAVGFTPWMGGLVISGGRKMVAAIRSYAEEKISGSATESTWIDSDALEKLKKKVPAARLARLAETFDHLNGKSIDFPLRLAYWKSGTASDDAPLDPARDGGGIIWYACVVPMKPERVNVYVSLVERTCRAHGLDPLFTLVCSDLYLFGIVPILFDRGDDGEVRRAQACFGRLAAEGRSEGFIPYRIPAHAMDSVVDSRIPFWALVKKQKAAVDPKEIVSPGRYSPRS